MSMQLKVSLRPKALTGCNGLAGSDLQDRGVPSEHSRQRRTLFVIMPANYLFVENMCLDTNKLKMYPEKVPTKKNLVGSTTYK